jgi:hypothetical protein
MAQAAEPFDDELPLGFDVEEAHELPENAKSACKCTACDRVFSSVTSFDRHQTGHARVVCHHPRDRGLVLRSDGLWTRPDSGDAERPIRGGRRR